MDRTSKVFEFANRNGRGLEIGPSHSPVAPKSQGFDCVTIDHAGRETLVEKYRGLGVAEDMLSRIEDVDYIWSGERLTELVTEQFDYVIASHVLEHTVDLVAFLQDCEEILKPKGCVSLILPDKRYCFDYFRPLTSVGRVIDASCTQDTRFHTPGTAADGAAYMCTMESVGVSWWPGADAPIHLESETLSRSDASIQESFAQREYVDLHNWVFTPSSFELLIRDLNELEFTNFSQIGGHPTRGCEFFATLRIDPAHQHTRSREELMYQIDSELFEASTAEGELKAENERLKAELAKATAANSSMRTSRSWRVTAPLRRASRLAVKAKR